LADVLDARWLAAWRGAAVAAVLALLWPRYVELREAPAVAPREWALAAAAGLAVFAAWIAFDSGWATFGHEGTGLVPLGPDGRIDVALVALRAFGMVLVVPVMEELFWRSFLMRWIDRRDFLAADARRASLGAVALSSALFALAHTQWFAGLLAGLAYAWLYRRSGSVRVPILAHAVTNGALAAWILATGSWRFW
ncbi:MAG TPA: CAAX prenyl protease-related protein, partial [Myxococcota bacterium]|nr:CAAX prenyl protease-related protein [Myxococcota bacterium]